MKWIPRALGVVLAGYLGVAFAGCGSGSSVSNNAKPAPPMIKAVLMPLPTARNIAPNANSLERWTQLGSPPGPAMGRLVKGAGAKGAAQFDVTGNGNPPTVQINSPYIRVVPNRTYSFSAQVDTTQGLGPTLLWVTSPSGNAVYGQALVVSRAKGRYGFKVRIPGDVTQVAIGFYTHSCRLGKGRTISFSQPVFAVSTK